MRDCWMKTCLCAGMLVAPMAVFALLPAGCNSGVGGRSCATIADELAQVSAALVDAANAGDIDLAEELSCNSARLSLESLDAGCVEGELPAGFRDGLIANRDAVCGE